MSEEKRNCIRATECGQEVWNVNHELMDKNQIEGVAGINKLGSLGHDEFILSVSIKPRQSIAGGCLRRPGRDLS